MPSEQENPLEALKAAFHSDNAPLVRQLLDAHPAFRTRLGDPVMAFDSPPIIHVRSRAMLDVLLDAGADINARSTWWAGSFGLLDAAPLELAHYALQRGATLTAHAAARLGLLDRLREMVGADPSLVHARGGDGQTPLHFASSIEIADFLLDHGADIDARDIDHESTPAQWMIKERHAVARHLATRGCHTDILMASALGDRELILRHLAENPASIGISVSAVYFPMRDPRAGGTIYTWTLGLNATPHSTAARFGHPGIVALLMEHSPQEIRLAEYAASGNEAAARALLAGSPDLIRHLTKRDHDRLVSAAVDNRTDVVRLMLELGWPADARGQHGGTALHWACFHGNAAMAGVLLQYHPPLEATDHDYHATPLGWALHGSENGWQARTGDYPATVEALLRAGAKPPAALRGTPGVQEVLKRHGVR
ncbi:MAG TPA: ankyrin repeat domain-containing protein [Candidatus Limnocylindria bacterium]|jgi:ankyrin repeat protein|nr:ankyrin repeat domain-containing protein [Candidatus Limnocylindria bacterium]